MHGALHDKRIRDVEQVVYFKNGVNQFSKIFLKYLKWLRVSLYRVLEINNTRGVFFDKYLEYLLKY